MVPLIHAVSDRVKMGKFVIKGWIKIAAWLCTALIVALNVKLVYDEITSWMASSSNLWVLQGIIVVLCFAAMALLIYTIVLPFARRRISQRMLTPHGTGKPLIITGQQQYRKIAIAVDFSDIDSKAISQALSQGGKEAEYLLVHVVETPGAQVMGSQIRDYETAKDTEFLDAYVKQIESEGYAVKKLLGYGNPKKEIPRIVNGHEVDLLVMGAHDHSTLKDMIFGTTINAVRHKIKGSVLIVS